MMDLRKRIDDSFSLLAKIVSILIFPLAMLLFSCPLLADTRKIDIAGLQVKSAMNVQSDPSGDTPSTWLPTPASTRILWRRAFTWRGRSV